MIKEWLDEYNPKNLDEAAQALREIMQEIALAGLQRSGFFEKAAFLRWDSAAYFARFRQVFGRP